MNLGPVSKFRVFYRRLKSWVTAVAIVSLLVVISLFLSYNINEVYTSWIIFGSFCFACFVSLVSYIFNEKIVRASTGMSYEKDVRILNLVEKVAQQANMRTPTVYSIPSPGINACAFGTGFFFSKCIALTEGIKKHMNDAELECVIAHELAHIKNKDVLIAVVTGSIVLTLSLAYTIISNIGISSSSKDDDDNNTSSLYALLIKIIAILIFGVFAKLIAPIIALAINRNREYTADAIGAKIIGSGERMANTLQKIEDLSVRVPKFKTSQAQYFFVPALWMIEDLLSTHPSIPNRMEKVGKLGSN